MKAVHDFFVNETANPEMPSDAAIARRLGSKVAVTDSVVRQLHNEIWEGIADAIGDDYAYETALRGARIAARLDRAFRGALGHEMRIR